MLIAIPYDFAHLHITLLRNRPEFVVSSLLLSQHPGLIHLRRLLSRFQNLITSVCKDCLSMCLVRYKLDVLPNVINREEKLSCFAHHSLVYVDLVLQIVLITIAVSWIVLNAMPGYCTSCLSECKLFQRAYPLQRETPRRLQQLFLRSSLRNGTCSRGMITSTYGYKW
jgi:hypothetical protein